MVHVFSCESSYSSILSAFYDAWKFYRDAEVYFEVGSSGNLRLFSSYHTFVEADSKVRSIESMIRKNLGEQTLYAFSMALLSNEPSRADHVFRVLQLSRNIPNKHLVMEHLGNDHVRQVFELKRQVGNEAHKLQGFIRFRELTNGVLFSEITPKNQVLTIFADFFQNRFPLENWMIYDHTNKLALAHPKGCHYFLMSPTDQEIEQLCDMSNSTDPYEGLWKIFFESVSIKERENKDLQRNLMPLRYRKHMIEFS